MFWDDVGALGLLQKKSCSRVILWGSEGEGGLVAQRKWDRHSGNMLAEDIFSAILVTSSLL